LYGITQSIFLDSAKNFLTTWDLTSALIKAFVFGVLIAIIGASWGLTTTGGAKGVGQSTTTAVVTALMTIFISNFFLSWLMFQGTGNASLGV
ncbi:MAG: ABC transporter permease, partial [Pseudanabaenales cyanobacterium]|nr:ABC transporter permease [Pseudanabaenales cyanobacterium]